jgi:hypothetical protein
VTVLYYDDPSFDSISDQSGLLSDACTFCFGGQAESVILSNLICNGYCVRGRSGRSPINCCLIPCWPHCCLVNSSCAHKHTIFPQDALHFQHELRKARQAATDIRRKEVIAAL